MNSNRKGKLKDNFTLLEVDAINYTVYKGDPLMETPELLSLGEFKAGKSGKVLFNHNNSKLTFGPEKFGKLK